MADGLVSLVVGTNNIVATGIRTRGFLRGEVESVAVGVEDDEQYGK
jgi:hypothetical protein